LNITDYSSLITVKQNGTNSTTVTVKNINTTRTQDLKLSIIDINSSWVSVSPTLTSVTPLNSTTFTVTFSVPSDAEIKDYSGKYVAIGNYVNVTQTFTLRVLPSETKEAEINQSLALFRLNMTELGREINESKSQGYNVSGAEEKLLELKVAIEMAENYIEQGDPFNAYQLFDSIETLIDEIKSELEEAKVVTGGFVFSFDWQQWMIWLVVAAGVGGGVFLAYLFWPTRVKRKSFAPKPPSKIKKFVSKPKEDPWKQLKEKWSKIKILQKKVKKKENK